MNTVHINSIALNPNKFKLFRGAKNLTAKVIPMLNRTFAGFHGLLIGGNEAVYCRKIHKNQPLDCSKGGAGHDHLSMLFRIFAVYIKLGVLTMALGGIPLSEWSGSGATRELHETIRQQIASTDKQSKVIGRLTVFMAVLAIVQTVAAIVQIIPIVQGYQDKNANDKLHNSASTLNKQESQPPVITHSNPPLVSPKTEAPSRSPKKSQ